MIEIIPGTGLDMLHFGMTKSEVFERLGFPNKSYLTASDCREVQYFALKLVLKFESGNDNRLGWMEGESWTPKLCGPVLEPARARGPHRSAVTFPRDRVLDTQTLRIGFGTCASHVTAWLGR